MIIMAPGVEKLWKKTKKKIEKQKRVGKGKSNVCYCTLLPSKAIKCKQTIHNVISSYWVITHFLFFYFCNTVKLFWNTIYFTTVWFRVKWLEVEVIFDVYTLKILMWKVILNTFLWYEFSRCESSCKTH